jgi:hypothetical protein
LWLPASSWVAKRTTRTTTGKTTTMMMMMMASLQNKMQGDHEEK